MLPYPLPGRIYGQARIGMKYAVFQSVKVLASHGREDPLRGPCTLRNVSAGLPTEPDHGCAVHLLDAVERRKFPVSAQDPSDPFLKVPKHGLHSPRLPNDFSHPRVGLVLGALPRLTQAVPQHSWIFERFLQLLDPGKDFVHVLKRGRSLFLGFR